MGHVGLLYARAIVFAGSCCTGAGRTFVIRVWIDKLVFVDLLDNGAVTAG
jgi:hypothetical protein